MPRSRGSSVTSDDYTSCLGAICSFIGCLLCFTKMKPSSRIFLTWLWLLVIAVVGGSIVSNVYFTSTSMTLHPSDMRIVDMKSTNWCSNVELSSDQAVDIYRLPTKPTLLTETSKKKTYKFRSIKPLFAKAYEHWEFYLLKGSSILIYICIEEYKGSVYVLQGNANFDKWKKHPSCNDCYAKHTLVAGGSCSFKYSRVQFNVEKTDQYYFVVYNENLQTSINVRLDFRLTRTVYELPEDGIICQQETTCTVPLDGDSKENLVAKYTPSQQSLASDQSTVKAKCNPRYYVFVPVFVLIPLCVGLAITGLIVARAKRSRSGRQRNSSAIFTISRSERDRTISGTASPAFVMEPPSYAECCEAPPTYDEVLRMKNLQSEA